MSQETINQERITGIEDQLRLLRAQLAHHNSIDVAEEIDALEHQRAVLAGEAFGETRCPDCGDEVDELEVGFYVCGCGKEYHLCREVVYDPDFTGGGHAYGSGDKSVYLRAAGLVNIEEAFTAATGLPASCIIWYAGDEYCTEEGDEVEQC